MEEKRRKAKAPMTWADWVRTAAAVIGAIATLIRALR